MTKKNNKIKNEFIYSEDNEPVLIPEIDNEEIVHKIRIYDPVNDGSYFYRKIGFNRKITDND